MARRRPRRRSLALLLLLLLFTLFGLNSYLAGFLPGGGRWPGDPAPGEEPGALEIVVYARSDRAPVSGATVHLSGLDGKETTRRTDAAGRARFAGLGAGPVHIEVEGEVEGSGGYATGWSRPGRRVELALAPRPKRTGRVLDGDDRPVAATVHLLDRDARVLASVETGEDGSYELPDHPSAVSVCAWPARGAPAASAWGDIRVGEGERYTGRSEDPGDGTIDVFATVPDSTEDRTVPLRVSWPLDAEGRYDGRLPAGARPYVFHGTHYALPLGESHHIAFLQLPRGRVVDEEGSPLGGVRVEARALSHGLPVSPNPHTIVRTTDADGRFDLGWGPSTSFELDLSAPGRARLVVPAPREPQDIVLPRGFRIGGRVMDSGDRPLALARVDAIPTPDPDARFREVRAATADDGRFWVDGLGGDHARVRVSMRGYRTKTMDRVPPSGFVTIRLERLAGED